MNIRTCPYCNYKYTIPEYVKHILFKIVFSEWDCKNCNKKITFNYQRRVNVALAFGGLLIALFLLIYVIKNTIGLTPITWITLLAFYVIGSAFIFTFDTFDKVA